MLATLKAVGPSVGLAKYKTKFCAHWQQGKCNYGDACRFSHDCLGGQSEKGIHPSVLHAQAPAGGMLSQELLEAAGLGGQMDAAVLSILAATPDQLPAAWPPQIDQLPAASPPQIGPASPPPLRQAAPNGRPKTKLCIHWQQFKCNYGDACNFSHACTGGPGDRGVFRGVRVQAEAESGAAANASQAAWTSQSAEAELLATLAMGGESQRGADTRAHTQREAELLADALAENLSPEALASLAAGQFGGQMQVDAPQPPPTGWAGVAPELQAQPPPSGCAWAHGLIDPQARFSMFQHADVYNELPSQPGFASHMALEEQVDAAVHLLQNPIVQRMMAARGLRAPPLGPSRLSNVPLRPAPY